MAEGAKWARDHGASLIDINMGCPVDKVTKKDGGSKLLCDPDRAVRIVEAVVEAVSPGQSGIPVTCKMRLGWFDDQPVAEWLAPRLVSAGAMAITIHGRTTAQKFSGEASRPGIKRVVETVRAAAPGIPVIGNGDVTEPWHAERMIRETGCDGVMIGRGALSTPWIFRDAWSLLTTGIIPAQPTRSDILDMMLRYFDLMLEHRGEHYAMTQMRRRVSWFAKRMTVPGCRRFREAVRTAADPAAVRDAIERFRAGRFATDDTDAALAGADAETI
jgi:nifR3 family TIM-barrel protein